MIIVPVDHRSRASRMSRSGTQASSECARNAYVATTSGRFWYGYSLQEKYSKQSEYSYAASFVSGQASILTCFSSVDDLKTDCDDMKSAPDRDHHSIGIDHVLHVERRRYEADHRSW